MTKPFDPTKTVMYWSRTLTLTLNRYLEGQMPLDDQERLPEIQAMTIGYLFQNQDRIVLQKDIERHLQIRKSTTSTLIKRMVNKGLLVTQPAPQDSRAKQIRLTPLALNQMHRIDVSAQKVEKQLRKGISDTDFATFLKVIQQIKKNTE